MRQFIHRQGEWLGLGAAGSSCGGVDPTTQNNSIVSSLVGQCVQSALAAAGANVQQQLSNVWASIEQSVASVLLAEGKAVVAGASFVASAAAIDAAAVVVLNLISTGAGAALNAAITGTTISLLADVGLTISSAVAIGAGAGLVGIIIGLLVGVIIGIADALNPHSVETTYGTTVGGNDYIHNNIQNAANWLNSPPNGSLAGVTSIWLAKKFQIFLANPIWLWANWPITGMCQPLPPNDLGNGDQVDVIFTQFPGAFELLSKAQFIEANAFVSAHLAKLPFFQQVTPGSNTSYDPNPFHYSAWVVQPYQWAPDQYSDGVPVTDLADNDVWPPGSENAAHETPPTNPNTTPNTGFTIPWPDNSSDAAGGGQQVPNGPCCPSCPGSTTNGPMGSGARIPYNYAACPNLVTNDNTTDSSGNITGQTNVCPGIYMLQVFYPALTADQCLRIFAANAAPFATITAISTPPPNLLGPGGGTTTSPTGTASSAPKSSIVGIAAKTVAVAGGVGAMAVGVMALRSGQPASHVAIDLYESAKKAVLSSKKAVLRRL